MATASQGANGAPETMGFFRWIIALIIGLTGALFVWIVTPYNNFIIFNSFVSDDFLPVASVFAITVISLLINPLIRIIKPSLALNFKQLALIFAILLGAAVTPSQGLLRALPYAIADASVRASGDKMLADAYAALDPHASLFPDTLEYGAETPIADPFIGELNPGQSIPWSAWIPPLISWSGFLIPWWVMMVALGVIVFPQWRDNERLPFPLLSVQQSLIEAPAEGKKLPPIFGQRSFLAGLGFVFVLHFLTGLEAYRPGTVPVIPVSWDIARFFTEEPLNYLPAYIKWNRIHFMFLGMAFFMPNRVGFSIWSFQIIYAIYTMIYAAYFPPFPGGLVQDHNTGAFIGMAVVIIFLGRSHWLHVIKCMIGKVSGAEGRSHLISGWAFAFGCAGMFAWLTWVKMPVYYTIFLIIMAVIFALVMTRIVAETGLPLIAPETSYTMRLLRLIPAGWHTPVSAWFGGFVSLMIGHGNRLCVSVFTTHAIGLDRQSTQSKRLSTGGIVLFVIIVSLVVCGAVHLYATHHHSVTLDGRESPISGFGINCFSWTSNALLFEQQKGAMSVGNYNEIGHISFGVLFTIFLQYMCLTFTWWPFHPVAMLFVATWYAHRVWVSVFLGWLAKVLILRYGGSRIYRAASPFFVGLVIGEVLSVAFWVTVSGIRAFNGLPYEIVEILPF
ncbi:hypothetical protein JXA32_07350 [Candidatus Sumerlaeota bacterium]|nr:hypothetical protein [Candidatus Sumerlaeota bacterium]